MRRGIFLGLRFQWQGFSSICLLFCLAFSVTICGSFIRAEAFQKVTGERGEMLVGELSTKELFKGAPVFKQNADEYQPDAKALESIKGLKERISIVMFLGTWCGDSIRESPKLLKILDAAKNPKISLTIYGVDTEKNDGKGLAKKYGIERVPTMIFLKGDKELGRIVENPEVSIEADFLSITGAK